MKIDVVYLIYSLIYNRYLTSITYFLSFDEDGALYGAERTTEDIVISCTVSGVHAYPVTSIRTMLEKDEDGEAVSTADQSFSAMILLDDATFYADLQQDGTYQIETHLTNMRVFIPIINDIIIISATRH